MLQKNHDQLFSEGPFPEILIQENTTIVGENHIKTATDPKVEADFQSRLNQARFIVIEHDCLDGNLFSAQSSHPRFMQQAQEHSLSTGTPLLILDNEIDKDRYQLWPNTNVDIPREDFYFILGLHLAIKNFSLQTAPASTLSDLNNFFQNYFPDKDLCHSMSQSVYQTVFKDTSYQKLDLITDIILRLTKIDSLAREIYYQKRLKGIHQNLSGRNLLVVIGRDHAKPIAETLQNGKITQIEKSQISLLQGQLSNLTTPPASQK